MERQKDFLDRLFRAAVRRVDPYTLVRSLVRLEDPPSAAGGVLVFRDGDRTEKRFPLADFDRIVVIGAGKASAPMARAVEELLGGRIAASLVVVKYGHTDAGRGPFRHVVLREAGHPVPDAAGLAASLELVELAKSCDRRTLVINLISGGGSALLPAPLFWDGGALTLADKQETTGLLLKSGVDIQGINSVRKHLSFLKGGKLAALLSPAMVVTLLLSDVVGDPLDVIASGLTVPDPTTWQDTKVLLEGAGVFDQLPSSVTELIRAGLSGLVPETPKTGDPAFSRVENLLIGSNFMALKAAESAAKEAGFRTHILSSTLTGEARELALVFLSMAREQTCRELYGPGPLVILAGGESTVTIRSDGKGGRNQEMALAFLAGLSGLGEPLNGVLFLSAATDGDDGPTDAAGAFASMDMLRQADSLGLDPGLFLARNDAYHFFERIEGLYKTGPTNTNVCDLQFLLVE